MPKRFTLRALLLSTVVVGFVCAIARTLSTPSVTLEIAKEKCDSENIVFVVRNHSSGLVFIYSNSNSHVSFFGVEVENSGEKHSRRYSSPPEQWMLLWEDGIDVTVPISLSDHSIKAAIAVRDCWGRDVFVESDNIELPIDTTFGMEQERLPVHQ